MSRDHHDDDTTPLRLSAASPVIEPSWLGAFDDLPPAKVRSLGATRRPLIIKVVVAAVAVAAVAGLAFWLLRPSPDGSRSADAAGASTPTPARSGDDDRLTRLLPAGYPPGTCTPSRPARWPRCPALGTPDWSGPASATFTLARDPAALAAAFDRVVGGVARVDCPGRIQSPGPWRRQGITQAPNGTLFCGFDGSRATVAWTTDADRMLSVARADSTGPTLDRFCMRGGRCTPDR